MQRRDIAPPFYQIASVLFPPLLLSFFKSIFLLLNVINSILKNSLLDVVPFTISFQSLLPLPLPLLRSGPLCTGPMAVSPTSDVLLARWCIQRLLCLLDANSRRRPCGIVGITLLVIFHVMMKMMTLMRIRGRGKEKEESAVWGCFHFLANVFGISWLCLNRGKSVHPISPSLLANLRPAVCLISRCVFSHWHLPCQ